MPPLLLVMLGGAVGSGARFLVGGLALARLGPGFPWGTLSVNLAGGLLMGVLAGTLAKFGGSEPWRLFLGVGVIGGFTTFSAFSLECHAMILRGDLGPAFGYALVSVVGAVAALFAGVAVARSFA